MRTRSCGALPPGWRLWPSNSLVATVVSVAASPPGRRADSPRFSGNGPPDSLTTARRRGGEGTATYLPPILTVARRSVGSTVALPDARWQSGGKAEALLCPPGAPGGVAAWQRYGDPPSPDARWWCGGEAMSRRSFPGRPGNASARRRHGDLPWQSVIVQRRSGPLPALISAQRLGGGAATPSRTQWPFCPSQWRGDSDAL